LASAARPELVAQSKFLIETEFAFWFLLPLNIARSRDRRFNP
jgi:hypothetical protein